MACTNYPQQYYQMGTQANNLQNNTPVDNTYMVPAGNNQNANAYVQSDVWGNQSQVNVSAIPSSPLSVQPDGSGTPFVGPVQPEPLPETLTHAIYTPGYLRENIGQLARVEFLMGGYLTDRVGYLRSVGASYIVLEAVDYGSTVMCDLFSIKFVTILRSPVQQEIATSFTSMQ